MAPKRTKPQEGSAPKKVRKALSLDTKLDILNRYDSGQSTATIKHALNLPESTLRTIRANKDKIKENVQLGTSGSSQRTMYVQNPALKRTEEMVKDWINKQNQRNVPVSMGVIQAKAKELYGIVTKDDATPKPFAASSGWFNNFKARYRFHNVKFSGEAASADKPAADEFMETLKKYMEENQYLPEQVFNLDETSLYPYRTFERMYIAEEEKKKPGFKA